MPQTETPPRTRNEPVRVQDASVEELAAYVLRRRDWHRLGAVEQELFNRLVKSGHMTPGGEGFTGAAIRDLIF